jgi:thiosulfate/3-mercaptopyruvate sulfurtransferase
VTRRTGTRIDIDSSAMPTLLISTAELAAHLDDPAFAIVDVRHDLAQPDTMGESQYRAAHIPGARFAHMDRDLAAAKTGRNGRHPLPSPEACAALFGRLGIDASKQVVAYDAGGGMYAPRLWWMLRWLGHDAVAVLDGGFAKWVREGRPTNAAIPAPRPATFAVRGVDRTFAAADVLASLADRSLMLIDARGAERFRGEVEPLDPVAGHVPGAVNRPYLQNLEPDGTFKSPEKLRTEFASIVGATSAPKIVNMCGSGVSACHNMLAMELAGIAGTKLYPGSWSEWCADPSRPVARG